MTTVAETASTLPVPREFQPPLYRLSVRQYHDMLRQGILPDNDKVELIEGVLVQKMGRNPPHRFASQALRDLLPRLLPSGWFVDDQEEIITADSAAEPDIGIFRGTRRSFAEQGRHPGPEDTALVMEVSDTTLAYDASTKKRVYARARIPEYWIVNLVDRRIEVYTEPSGPGEEPTYQHRQDYGSGATGPLRLDGCEVGHIAGDDLIL